MLAAVLTQVDPLAGHGRTGHPRVDGEIGLGDKGDHHPVMGRIRLYVDHPGARATDGIGDGGDHLDATPFGEIRNALYEGCHTRPPTIVCSTRFTPR